MPTLPELCKSGIAISVLPSHDASGEQITKTTVKLATLTIFRQVDINMPPLQGFDFAENRCYKHSVPTGLKMKTSARFLPDVRLFVKNVFNL